MFNQANLSITIQVLTLLGIAWAIYNSLKRPQERSELNDAVFNNKFLSLENMVKKIELNDLHELRGMMNTHITNQAIQDREIAEKIGGILAKLDILINK
jgi:hypothetical protein